MKNKGPVERNNILPQLNGANGLNGWFGKLVKKLAKAAFSLAATIPIVGPVFKDTFEKWSNDVQEALDNSFLFNQRTAPDYEPTASEAAILERWAETKLNPFYKAMVTQLSNAFAMSNFDAQLIEVNNVILKMCIAKSYFANNETAGLSANAVKARLELLNQIFLPVESLITKSVAKYDTVLTLNNYVFTVTSAKTTQFSPLIAVLTNGQQFTCNKYVDTNKPNTPPVKVTTPVKTGTTTTLPFNPVKPATPATPATPVTPVTPVTTPVTPATSITTPTTTPTTEIVTDEETEVKSYFTVKNGLFGLAALLVVRELFKKKKKK